jgi:cytoskeletal protein CcmA (bactofilin family)
MYRTVVIFALGLLLGLALDEELPQARAEPVADLNALFSTDARGRLVLKAPKGLIIEGALSAHQLEVTRGSAVFRQAVEAKRGLAVGEELKVDRGILAASLDLDGALRVRKGLRVGGPAQFDKSVEIEQLLKSGMLEVEDRTRLRGDVVHERTARFDGDVVMRRSLTVEDLTVKDDVAVAGDTLMRGDLRVEGTLQHRR